MGMDAKSLVAVRERERELYFREIKRIGGEDNV